MTKTELINVVAEKTGFSKKDSDKAVVAVIDAISEALAGGDKVQLVGFGTFEVRARKEREAGKPPKSARELYRMIHSFELTPIVLEAHDEDDEHEGEASDQAS